MGGGVGFGSVADIATFDVGNNNQVAFGGLLDQFVVAFDAFPEVAFKEGDC